MAMTLSDGDTPGRDDERQKSVPYCERLDPPA
jgi:hypothetical protein